MSVEECKVIIPGTFIACGEGGNYCSEPCKLAADRLAAAHAPAMARLLLEMEWSFRDEGGNPCCPCCKGDKPDQGRPWLTDVGHTPDCEIATVLRAAGVLPP